MNISLGIGPSGSQEFNNKESGIESRKMENHIAFYDRESSYFISCRYVQEAEQMYCKIINLFLFFFPALRVIFIH